jgi:hypothetical protein
MVNLVTGVRVDETHRLVFAKYGAIFDWFDGLPLLPRIWRRRRACCRPVGNPRRRHPENMPVSIVATSGL